MKLIRLATFALLATSLTSCSTLGGIMNSYPYRILDQTGSALMGYLAENELPADGQPASLEDRAKKVESRGIYAGHASPAVQTDASRVSMASR